MWSIFTFRSKRKRSSNQAMAKGQTQMKCKRALFTHFPQRYSKVPLFEEFRVDL